MNTKSSNVSFLKLTPTANYEIPNEYKKALDFAFSDESIKNIAITGPYGSGKTTLWKTYQNHSNFKNNDIIHISLGQYSFEENNKLDKQESDRIEKQIINQILYQIPTWRIPLVWHKIEKSNLWTTIVKAILTTLFLVSVISLIFIAKNTSSDLNIFKKICLSVNSVLLVMTIFWFFFINFWKGNFRWLRINIGKIKITNKDDDKESLLDKNIREVIYILKHSKIKMVVFEDLDRFDDLKLFTKLRELNFIVNQNKVKHIMRFVYIIKSDLFSNGQQITKFFDFIVNINFNNSWDILSMFLNKMEIKFNYEFTFTISKYITDIRLLKNIINDLAIFQLNQNQLEINENLFALLVVRNMFLHEYNLLLKKQGIVFETIVNIQKQRNQLLADFEKQIKILDIQMENEKRIEIKNRKLISTKIIPKYFKDPKEDWFYFLGRWQNEPPESLSYFVKIPEEDCYITDFIKFVSFLEIKSNIYDKELLNPWIYSSTNIHNQKIEKHKIQYQINELVGKNYVEKTFEYSGNDFSNKLFKDCKWNEMQIIKYFLEKGYINEFWEHAISYRYKDHFTNKELKFLKNLNNSEEPDLFLEIEDPQKICATLSEEDYKKKTILNKNMLKYIINSKPEKMSNIFNIINKTNLNNNFEYLTKILESINDNETIDNFVQISFQQNINILFDCLDYFWKKQSQSSNDIEIEIYLLLLISIFTKNFKYLNIDDIDKTHNLKFWLKSNFGVMKKINLENQNDFFSNVISQKIKFESLYSTKIDYPYIIYRIEKNRLYDLTLENVIWIYENITKEEYKINSFISDIFSNLKLSETKSYIESSFEEFIEKYIDYNQYCKFENDEYITEKILCSNISKELKIKYIKRNKTKISPIHSNNIDEQAISEINNELLKHNQIKFNS